jgi:hypothetical protein
MNRNIIRSVEERIKLETRIRPDPGYVGSAILDFYGSLEPITKIMTGSVSCTGRGTNTHVEITGRRVIDPFGEYNIVPSHPQWIERIYVFLEGQVDNNKYLTDSELERYEILVDQVREKLKAGLREMPVDHDKNLSSLLGALYVVPVKDWVPPHIHFVRYQRDFNAEGLAIPGEIKNWPIDTPIEEIVEWVRIENFRFRTDYLSIKSYPSSVWDSEEQVPIPLSCYLERHLNDRAVEGDFPYSIEQITDEWMFRSVGAV